MRKGYVAAIVGSIILVGHIGLIPFVFLYLNSILLSEKIQVLLLIGPVTAAAVVTTVQFSMRNAAARLGETEVVNGFFVLVSLIVPVALIVFLYGACVSRQMGELSGPDDLKTVLGVLEIFLGASFALVVDGLFGTPQRQQLPPAGPAI